MRNGITIVGKIIRGLGIREDGGAIAETALTAPFLIALIFGSIEFARVAYASIEVTNAARAGVSYGAQSGLTASDTAGIIYAATNDGSNIPGLTVSTPIITYSCSDNSTPSGSPPVCASGHLQEALTVKTQVSMDPMVHIPGLPTTYTMSAAAVQNCYQ